VNLNLTDSLIDYYNSSYFFTNINLTIDRSNKNFSVCVFVMIFDVQIVREHLIFVNYKFDYILKYLGYNKTSISTIM